MNNIEGKRNVLHKLVEKYTPNLINNEIPYNIINGTAVTRVDITEMTEKYYL